MSSQRKRVLFAYYTEPFSVPVDTDAFEALAGFKPDSIMWFISWNNSFPKTTLDSIISRGQFPILTWQPSVTGGNPSTNTNILAGTWDTYIRTFAQAAKDWDHPLILRMGHEMNGNGWYQWQDANYPAMWRYVWNIFDSLGVKNVKWFWCPNKIFPGSLDLATVFPGTNYVDMIGIDAYNRGNPTSPQFTAKWDVFDDLFPPTLAAIRALAPGKPTWIGECGCPEPGGSKAAWFADLLLKARVYSLEGVTYFNTAKVGDPDYRINTTPASLQAFQDLTPVYL